eukprot:scaffold107486_cov67-Cyclotella_meneghiniana.AAC.1
MSMPNSTSVVLAGWSGLLRWLSKQRVSITMDTLQCIDEAALFIFDSTPVLQLKSATHIVASSYRIQDTDLVQMQWCWFQFMMMVQMRGVGLKHESD